MPRICKCCRQGKIEILGDLIKVCGCGYGHAPCMALGLPLKEAFYDLFYAKKDMSCLTCGRDIPCVRLFFAPHRVFPAMKWGLFKCLFPLGKRALHYHELLSRIVIPAWIASILPLSLALYVLGVPRSFHGLYVVLSIWSVISGTVMCVLLLGFLLIEFSAASFCACFARFLVRRRGNVWLFVGT